MFGFSFFPFISALLLAGVVILVFLHLYKSRISYLKKHKQWQILFEAVPVGVLIFREKDNQILEVNTTALDILDRERKELMGNDCFQVVDHQDMEGKTYQYFGQKEKNRELYITNRSGTRIPVLVSFQKIKIDNDLFFIESISDFRRISKTEEALEDAAVSYKRLFEEVKIPIFRTTLNGHIQSGNNALKDSLGLTLLDQSINLWSFIEKEIEREYLSSILKLDRVVDNMELSLIRKDGTGIIVMLSASVINNEGEDIVEGSFVNITLKKELEEEQKKLHDLESRSRHLNSVTNLAAGIAHDINNILAGISAHAQVLNYKIKEPDLLKSVSRILEGGTRADEILKGLLTTIGSFDLNRENIDLADFLGKQVKKFQEHYSGISIRYIKLINDVSILVDKEILSALLKEVVDNAVKASTLDDEVIVSVSKEKPGRILYDFLDQKEELCAIVAIFDMGKGIPEEHLERIFEPYYTTEQFGNGAGLGLSKVYGIIQKMHGAIGLESGRRKGTSFYIYLPLKNEDNPIK